MTPTGQRVWDSFTSREKEIVFRICTEGNCDRMGIKNETLRAHFQHIFDKSGMSSRLEVVVFAYRTGMVTP